MGMKMKAQSNLMWVFIGSVVVLLVLTAVSPAIQSSVDTSIKTSARLNAQNIVSIINMLQASPAVTTHTYKLPMVLCKIEIAPRDMSRYVKVTMNNDERNSYTLNIIETGMNINVLSDAENKILECSNSETVEITFTRYSDRIEIAKKVS